MGVKYVEKGLKLILFQIYGSVDDVSWDYDVRNGLNCP